MNALHLAISLVIDDSFAFLVVTLVTVGIGFLSYLAHLLFCRWFIRRSHDAVKPQDAIKLLSSYRPPTTVAVVKAVADALRSARNK